MAHAPSGKTRVGGYRSQGPVSPALRTICPVAESAPAPPPAEEEGREAEEAPAGGRPPAEAEAEPPGREAKEEEEAVERSSCTGMYPKHAARRPHTGCAVARARRAERVSGAARGRLPDGWMGRRPWGVGAPTGGRRSGRRPRKGRGRALWRRCRRPRCDCTPPGDPGERGCRWVCGEAVADGRR